MKEILIVICISIVIGIAGTALTGCITYEKIENGKKSGFSTNPIWWIQKHQHNKQLKEPSIFGGDEFHLDSLADDVQFP